jgi:Carboxypeptidase regulatory-like domain
MPMLLWMALLSCAHLRVAGAPTLEACQGGDLEACRALAASSPEDDHSVMLDRWACGQGYAPSCAAMAEVGLSESMMKARRGSCAEGDMSACNQLLRESSRSGQITRLRILPGDADGPLAVLPGGSLVQVTNTAVTLANETGLKRWPTVPEEGKPHLNRVRALHATADGRLLAAAVDPLVVWSLGDGAIIRLDAWPEAVAPVAFSPDGLAVAGAMSHDAGVAMWALPDGRPLGVTPGIYKASELLLGPAGLSLAVRTARGWFTVAPGAAELGPRTSELDARAAVAGHPIPERAADYSALSRDGRLLALSTDESVVVVNMDGAVVAEATLPKTFGRPIWSPDGGHLAVKLAGGAVAVLTLGKSEDDPASDEAILATDPAPPPHPAAGTPQLAIEAEQRGVVTLLGAPGAGAEVTATPCSEGPPPQVTHTAGDGSFTMKLSRGCWAVVASGLGAVPTDQMKVRVGENTPLNLPLIGTTVATGTVKGRDGHPAAGVEVRARLSKKEGSRRRGDSITATTITDSKGRFTLSPVNAEGFRVEAIGAYGGLMEVWEDPSKSMELSLVPALAVRVIRDPNATRDPELWVTQGLQRRKVELPADGTWLTTAVSVGEEVRLSVHEGIQFTPEVTVTTPTSGELLLQGPAYGQLEVRLPRMRPVDVIQVVNASCPREPKGCKTGWIPAGTYEVYAHAEDHRAGVATVEVNPGATTVLDAPLSNPTGDVTGRVVSAAGHPLAAVAVSVRCGAMRNVSAVTGPDGRFRLERVSPSEILKMAQWKNQVSLEASGWHTSMLQVKVQPGGTVDLGDLTLLRE